MQGLQAREYIRGYNRSPHTKSRQGKVRVSIEGKNSEKVEQLNERMTYTYNDMKRLLDTKIKKISPGDGEGADGKDTFALDAPDQDEPIKSKKKDVSSLSKGLKTDRSVSRKPGNSSRGRDKKKEEVQRYREDQFREGEDYKLIKEASRIKNTLGSDINDDQGYYQRAVQMISQFEQLEGNNKDLKKNAKSKKKAEVVKEVEEDKTPQIVVLNASTFLQNLKSITPSVYAPTQLTVSAPPPTTEKDGKKRAGDKDQDKTDKDIPISSQYAGVDPSKVSIEKYYQEEIKRQRDNTGYNAEAVKGKTVREKPEEEYREDIHDKMKKDVRLIHNELSKGAWDKPIKLRDFYNNLMTASNLNGQRPRQHYINRECCSDKKDKSKSPDDKSTSPPPADAKNDKNFLSPRKSPTKSVPPSKPAVLETQPPANDNLSAKVFLPPATNKRVSTTSIHMPAQPPPQPNTGRHSTKNSLNLEVHNQPQTNYHFTKIENADLELPDLPPLDNLIIPESEIDKCRVIFNRFCQLRDMQGDISRAGFRVSMPQVRNFIGLDGEGENDNSDEDILEDDEDGNYLDDTPERIIEEEAIPVMTQLVTPSKTATSVHQGGSTRFPKPFGEAREGYGEYHPPVVDQGDSLAYNHHHPGIPALPVPKPLRTPPTPSTPYLKRLAHYLHMAKELPEQQDQRTPRLAGNTSRPHDFVVYSPVVSHLLPFIRVLSHLLSPMPVPASSPSVILLMKDIEGLLAAIDMRVLAPPEQRWVLEVAPALARARVTLEGVIDDSAPAQSRVRREANTIPRVDGSGYVEYGRGGGDRDDELYYGQEGRSVWRDMDERWGVGYSRDENARVSQGGQGIMGVTGMGYRNWIRGRVDGWIYKAGFVCEEMHRVTMMKQQAILRQKRSQEIAIAEAAREDSRPGPFVSQGGHQSSRRGSHSPHQDIRTRIQNNLDYYDQENERARENRMPNFNTPNKLLTTGYSKNSFDLMNASSGINKSSHSPYRTRNQQSTVANNNYPFPLKPSGKLHNTVFYTIPQFGKSSVQLNSRTASPSKPVGGRAPLPLPKYTLTSGATSFTPVLPQGITRVRYPSHLLNKGSIGFTNPVKILKTLTPDYLGIVFEGLKGLYVVDLQGFKEVKSIPFNGWITYFGVVNIRDDTNMTVHADISGDLQQGPPDDELCQKQLVVGEDNGQVSLFSLFSLEKLRSFSAHTQPVLSIIENCHGKALITMDSQAVLRLWNLGSKKTVTLSQSFLLPSLLSHFNPTADPYMTLPVLYPCGVSHFSMLYLGGIFLFQSQESVIDTVTLECKCYFHTGHSSSNPPIIYPNPAALLFYITPYLYEYTLPVVHPAATESPSPSPPSQLSPIHYSPTPLTSSQLVVGYLKYSHQYPSRCGYSIMGEEGQLEVTRDTQRFRSLPWVRENADRDGNVVLLWSGWGEEAINFKRNNPNLEGKGAKNSNERGRIDIVYVGRETIEERGSALRKSSTKKKTRRPYESTENLY